MKNLIYPFFAAILFASCGDNGSDEGKHAHVQVAVPNKVTVVSTSETVGYAFTYDAARRIEKINCDSNINANDAEIELFYDGDNRITSFRASGVTLFTRRFLYDQNGRLDAYVDNGSDILVDIAYDGATGIYTFPDGTFSLKDNGDLKSWNGSNLQYQSGNGVMTNVNNNYHILGLFMDEPFRLFACRGVFYGDGQYVAPSPAFYENMVSTIDIDGSGTYGGAYINIEYIKVH